MQQHLGAQLRCPHCGNEHPREARACPMTGRPMPGSLQPGQTLDGKYRIVRHIADGGMGAVYEAEHLLIGKRVAIKSLHPALAGDNELMTRFQQEARAASAIGHEHIVDMQDMGRAPDGAPFIVMELLRGQNLAERARALGGKVPLGRAAHILKQVLEALSAAHRVGIVHRDLKPENIFLVHRGQDPDFVKVVDFGISKVIGDPQAKLATTGMVLGTPYYMAPEQARGFPTDHRADIYACGAILYQMLTGQLPFTAPNFNALMFAIASGQYTRPRQLSPDIPAEIEQTIAYAMALDPAHRYQTAEHLAQTLAAFAKPISAPPPAEESPMPVGVPRNDFAGPADPTRTPSAVKAFVPPPGDMGTATPVPLRHNVMQAKPRRRKALPITIGAGIAVGVCVGLVIIKGTGKKEEASAAPAEDRPAVVGTVAGEKPVDKPTGPVAEKPAEPVAEKPAEPVAEKPAEPVAEKPAEPVAVKPADRPVAEKPAEPQIVTGVVSFTVEPAEAAPKITVDGKTVTGSTATVEWKGDKPAKVVAKASGYSTFEKKIPPGTTTVEIKLKKRTGGGSAPGGKIEL